MIPPPPLPNERLIVALDFPDSSSAMRMVNKLGNTVSFYKVGLELFSKGEGRKLVDDLIKKRKKVFVDLKLFDVPETVARATSAVASSGAHFMTVHGDDSIMRAAVEERGENLKILAVTVLTSLDDGDLRDLGFTCSAKKLVLHRAERALQLGADGVISSGMEISALREKHSNKLIIATPGVRLLDNHNHDDQKRIATPAQIIRDGGDYLVVGRPIRDAANPKKEAKKFQDEISTAIDKLNETPLLPKIPVNKRRVGVDKVICSGHGQAAHI